MASESTKLQVNFKLHDGTLLNIYAANQQELEASLTTLQDLSAMLTQTSQILSGVQALTTATPAPATNVVAMVQPVAATAAGDNPTCKHGVMEFKSGVGDRGPWRGYMCAGPKGVVDKCKAIYLK